MNKSQIRYTGFLNQSGSRRAAGALADNYAFGESAPQPGDLLSERVARQPQMRGESLSVFDLLAAAELVIGDDQFAIFQIELPQTFFQALVPDLGFDPLADVEEQV